jgi:hypothetical protein
MIGYLIIFYFASVFVYGCFMVIKRPVIDDKFFHLAKRLEEQAIIERIIMLGEMNSKDYSKEIVQVKKYFQDGRITWGEAEAIEKIITNTYFNGFERRWIAFKKADPSLKFFFIFCIAYSFFIINWIVYFGTNTPKIGDNERLITYAIANGTLILPYIGTLILTGGLSTFLSFLDMVLDNKGGVTRAAITSGELVKALKPGGRSTKVILNGPSMSRMAGPF